MSAVVRVMLVPQGVEAEAAAERQIIVDMLVDEGGMAIGPFPAFGRIGDYRKPATLQAFTLMADGRIDFGAFAAAELSQGKLAIRGRQLTPGARIDRDGEIFTITTITPLAAG